PSVPMRRSARCAMPSARCGGSTRKCRLFRDSGFGIWDSVDPNPSDPESRIPNPDMRKLRVVIAKPGLDGHDRGAKVIARALRDSGMEVIYTGLRQTPEQIAAAALQEDADVIGLSILSGAHNHIAPRLMELLRAKGLDDVLVLVGGIIPDVDIPRLKDIGIKGVFLPGTPMQDIIHF